MFDEARLLQRSEDKGQLLGVSRGQRPVPDVLSKKVSKRSRLSVRIASQDQARALDKHGIANDRRSCTRGSRSRRDRVDTQNFRCKERAELLLYPTLVGSCGSRVPFVRKHPAFVRIHSDNDGDGIYRARPEDVARLIRKHVPVDDG